MNDVREECVSLERERTGRYRGRGGIKFLLPAHNLNHVNLPVRHPLYCTYGVCDMFHKTLKYPLVEDLR